MIGSVSAAPRLSPGEVHVWQLPLDQPAERMAALAAVLTEAERARAGRFARAEVARRWIAGRALRRHVLARYAHESPAALAFTAAEGGKPFLLGSGGRPSALEFSMADSQARSLLAVTVGAAIGIDIEAIRPLDRMDGIVARSFSPREQAAYGELSPEQRRQAFFGAWTQKEAVAKALGLGLALPFASFTVSLDPAAPARLIEIGGDEQRAAAWSLRRVPAPPGYAAALAVAGEISALRVWPEETALRLAVAAAASGTATQCRCE
ncbi:MAG TPA: 4'-phosphopantetheinyl transferase superfamily protein [Alphaproteobacteria bacterium]|nr:4'-phosphopantetheinyl transferase superfamily protein [Alphaproteobacteria bacterium]